MEDQKPYNIRSLDELLDVFFPKPELHAGLNNSDLKALNEEWIKAYRTYLESWPVDEQEAQRLRQALDLDVAAGDEQAIQIIEELDAGKRLSRASINYLADKFADLWTCTPPDVLIEGIQTYRKRLSYGALDS